MCNYFSFTYCYACIAHCIFKVGADFFLYLLCSIERPGKHKTSTIPSISFFLSQEIFQSMDI